MKDMNITLMVDTTPSTLPKALNAVVAIVSAANDNNAAEFDAIYIKVGALDEIEPDLENN